MHKILITFLSLFQIYSKLDVSYILPVDKISTV